VTYKSWKTKLFRWSNAKKFCHSINAQSITLIHMQVTLAMGINALLSEPFEHFAGWSFFSYFSFFFHFPVASWKVVTFAPRTHPLYVCLKVWPSLSLYTASSLSNTVSGYISGCSSRLCWVKMVFRRTPDSKWRNLFFYFKLIDVSLTKFGTKWWVTIHLWLEILSRWWMLI